MIHKEHIDNSPNYITELIENELAHIYSYADEMSHSYSQIQKFKDSLRDLTASDIDLKCCIDNIKNNCNNIINVLTNIVSYGVSRDDYIYLDKVLRENYIIPKDYTNKFSKFGSGLFIDTVVRLHKEFRIIQNDFYLNEQDIIDPNMRLVSYHYWINFLEDLKNDQEIKYIIQTWVKRANGHSRGGVKAPKATEVLVLAVLSAIRSNNGESSLESVWDYFSGFDIDEPYEINGYEIYPEIEDDFGNKLTQINQKIVIAKDSYEKKVKYRSLYNYIKKACEEI